MKKLFLIPAILLGFLTGCTSEVEEVSHPVAQTNVEFVLDEGTRAADVDTTTNSWPSGMLSEAQNVVETVYTSPKSDLTAFLKDNYSLNLSNNKSTTAITDWNGSTDISLTELNTIVVTLTEDEGKVGSVPKFKTVTGTIYLGDLNLDTIKPKYTEDNYSGAIKITDITTDTNGVVHVSISITLEYDSYLLVAPTAQWSVLSNTKGFKELKWGGSTGTSFNTAKKASTANAYDWWYYWGSGDSNYVWGSGTLITYGFNLYTTGTTPIHVKNGCWYGLFASWSSAGEGDDDVTTTDPDDNKDKHHVVGGEGGLTPTADDVNYGGSIR